MHVEKTPRVGRKRRHFGGSLPVDPLRVVTVGVPAVEVGLVCGQVLTRVKGRDATRSTGVFPFALGGQAEMLTGRLIEPPDELLSVEPGDHFYRTVGTVGELAGILIHDCLPLTLGDFGPTDVERLGDSNPMPNLLRLSTDHPLG